MMRVLIAVAAMAVPSLARADVIQPEEAACSGKEAGDECYIDSNFEGGGTGELVMGSCQCSTCSKLDYSQGTPPTTKEVPCLLCIAGAMGGATSSCEMETSGGSTASGGSATNGGSGTGAQEPPAKEGKGCSGCSMDRTSLWSFGLGLGLLGFLRLGRAPRRRRPR